MPGFLLHSVSTELRARKLRTSRQDGSRIRHLTSKWCTNDYNSWDLKQKTVYDVWRWKGACTACRYNPWVLIWSHGDLQGHSFTGKIQSGRGYSGSLEILKLTPGFHFPTQTTKYHFWVAMVGLVSHWTSISTLNEPLSTPLLNSGTQPSRGRFERSRCWCLSLPHASGCYYQGYRAEYQT